jgi:hypothetical protein
MSYDRTRLPDPVGYYESQGLTLKGSRSAKWKTTRCEFHGGSDSMRINAQTGAFVCMAGCGARGGDVLAYHMAHHGMEFVEAAKALGTWVEDGRPQAQRKPTALSPRAALEVLGFESLLVAVTAGSIARGCLLTDTDRQRLMVCAGRINRIVGDFAS